MNSYCDVLGVNMTEPYYRVQAFLSRSALEHNVRLIQEKLKGKTRMMAVVKSNAYGHGVENVVPVLSSMGVDAYATATVDEGARVRRVLEEGGKERDSMILVLGYSDVSEYEKALENHLSLTVYSLSQAEALESLSEKKGVQAKVHIKLETGMQRIGFACSDESVESVRKIEAMDHLLVEGIFSHFARCDEKDKRYADEQWNRFDGFCQKLEKENVSVPIRHIANSAGIMEYEKAYTQPLPQGESYMARAGIMLYGLYPSDEMDREAMHLEPVMSLKSHVVHLKTVPEGTPVGYGGSFVTRRETSIATIPVGYGDGYPRHLSNKGSVLINGKRAPVIGRVCMDQLMADVTDIPGVSLLDEVTLFGEGLSLDEIAAQAGTISYEIVCQLTDRVPRVMTD